MKVLDIRQEYLLPQPFRIFGFTLMVLGAGLIIQGTLLLISSQAFSWGYPGGLSLLIIGALISLTHYRLSIDPVKKTFLEYTWVLGAKKGDERSYNSIERIYVNRVLQSTRMSSFTGHPRELKEYLYKAFLKLDNGDKIHLDSDTDETKLLNRVQEYERYLRVS